MVVELYRKLIKEEIRKKIYEMFLGEFLLFLRNLKENCRAKYSYLFLKILPDTTENKLYAFMGKHKLTPYPYPFMLEYKHLSVDCFFDYKAEMYYVMHCEKKLYYPKSFSKIEIVNNYRDLLTEQDFRSPHQYIENPNRLFGKIILDIGTAEGIFTLSHIEIIEHAYLFECDKKWIEALNATFAPWKEKVSIVPKYVSDINDDQNITVDQFLAKENIQNSNIFLKMDIEGYEQAALKGASDVFKNARDIDFSICTYHTKNAADEISVFFNSFGFNCEQTEGFFYYGKEFRKAIIRRRINN